MSRADDLPLQVQSALKAGRKVDAIKLLRKATGMGLMEAKDAVESVPLLRSQADRPHRAAAKNDTGVGRMILVFVVLGTCFAAYLFLSGS